MQKTFTPKTLKPADRQWYLVDAADKVVGRLATEIANKLRGKDKAVFSPHMDMGDYVVVINAEKVKLTGNKESQKLYTRHTGYLGHIYHTPFKTVQQRHPARILQEAISGMLPKNRLRRQFLDKLHVYPGSEHPHGGQNPITINL